jgi:hypothetical protein
VLHGLSRKEINQIHESLDIIKHDHLPPMGAAAAMMGRCGLQPEIMIDNAGMYMVCGRKDGGGD